MGEFSPPVKRAASRVSSIGLYQGNSFLMRDRRKFFVAVNFLNEF